MSLSEINSPLVSVILPVYNTEKYIKESIESILNQTYRDYELIILDDASTDNTPHIVASYLDSRIRLYKNESNLYISENRNKGLKLARGKYIVWQDADDISLPNRLEKLVNFMESHPEVGICGSYLQSFDETGLKDIRKYDVDDKSLRSLIFRHSPVAQPTAILRKSVIDLVGYYNPDYPPAEDLDMSFRIGNVSKFANLSEVLLFYREHPASNTVTRLQKQIDSTLRIRKYNMNNSNYHFTFLDLCAYYLTTIAKFLPARIVITLFKVLRIFSRILKK